MIKVMLPAILLLAMAAPAWGQALSRDDLMTALRQRDEAIAALEKRIAALEAERAAQGSAAAPATSAAPLAAATAAPDQPSATATASAGAVGDDTALQALSRGLVERGAIVLPRWSVEVAPSLAYSHTGKQGLVLVDTPDGVSTVSDQRQRQDGAHAAVAIRLGLPWSSQLEVRAPYDWSRESTALGDGSQVVQSAHGLGDVDVELSHQFLRESGWRPDLVGAMGWRFATGVGPFSTASADLANGVGSDGMHVRLTALKSADPMVFFSTLSYEHNLIANVSFGRVRPGDAVNWQLGGLLAVSPDTSVSLAFAQTFKGKTRVDGAAIAGSDGVASVLQFGVDQVLSPRALLDISVGVGVTRDAPDYTVMVSVPIRFR